LVLTSLFFSSFIIVTLARPLSFILLLILSLLYTRCVVLTHWSSACAIFNTVFEYSQFPRYLKSRHHSSLGSRLPLWRL
jgi:ABC-type methionine transport system permease subunit